MSISDGQIFLEKPTAAAGWNPSVLMTISRLGLDAATPAMRQLDGARIRLDILQADDAASNSSNAAAQRQERERAAMLREVLRQQAGHPLTLGETVAVAFAVQDGFFDGVPAAQAHALVEELLRDLREDAELLEELGQHRPLSGAVQGKLSSWLGFFFSAVDGIEARGGQIGRRHRG